MEHETVNLINNQDIEYLSSMFLAGPRKIFSRYHNLFSVERYDVDIQSSDPTWLAIKAKLDNYYPKGESIAHYFLRYMEGSFCTLHVDSPNRVSHTAITMLDKSDDLVGGDIIIAKRNYGIRRGIVFPTDKSIDEKKLELPKLARVKPLMTVGQQIGDTVWYSAGLTHGVSYVSRGHRLVLISWYKDRV